MGHGGAVKLFRKFISAPIINRLNTGGQVNKPANTLLSMFRKSLPVVSLAGLGAGTATALNRGSQSQGQKYVGNIKFNTPVYDWIHQAGNAMGRTFSPQEVNALALMIKKESGGNPRAINRWDCVPISTKILTKRGWLKHDEVVVGDHTIGYDIGLGHSRWTKISGIVHHDDADLVTISNSRWGVTTTANHRWLSFSREAKLVPYREDYCHLCDWPANARRRGKTVKNGINIHLALAHGIGKEKHVKECIPTPKWVVTEKCDARARLLVAAPAETESLLNITVQEAALLGWIASAGNVRKQNGNDTIRTTITVRPRPSKIARLKTLLTSVPHSLSIGKEIRTKTGNKRIGPHIFTLDEDYAADLISRAGHPREDSLSQVLSMSAEQREAWLESVIYVKGHKNSSKTLITQDPGTFFDAIATAIYLSGSRPMLKIISREHSSKKRLKGVISINNSIVAGSSLNKQDSGKGPVWCVTTELGSWTAMQGENIFLTGNSNARKGTPSKGLIQTIDPTFNRWKLPGHGNIYNPVDNIIAGVRYAEGRYGNLLNVPGVKNARQGKKYVGY